jgi:antitoxin component of MazEF toxin-antitoxin module
VNPSIYAGYPRTATLLPPLATVSQAGSTVPDRDVITVITVLRLRVRRIGNSLGIIVPKAVLDDWGVREGAALELTARSIRPPRRLTSTHDALDELKRTLAMAVVSAFTANQIRAQGLANLHRWRAMGSWVSAYDEWQTILESAGDGELFATMLGRDERANRLRQSPPYVGLLSREEVRRLNEEASA